MIYYDCTNFFYESTTETELRRPGASKENRRTPIVQMGIFMDADGLPLAFNINPGNTNEQTMLPPLEKMIGERMDIDEFIMCTDAGLSSGDNRLYNDTDRLGRTHHTIADLLKINRARWEIEESFRIMKTQMRARPVYHRTDRAIRGHFAICFVALFLYRVLEHRLGEAFTTDIILSTLRNMNALHIPSEGYIPTFKRTDLNDSLFEISGFRLDTEIIMLKRLKSIIAMTKKSI